MSEDTFPTVEDVYDVHEAIVRQWNLPHEDTHTPFPDQTIEAILDAARERDDPYTQAAELLRRLANAHVFEDGNKRTAWVVAKTSLRRQGLDVEPDGYRAATVLKHFKRYDVEELATWLRTGDVDESRLRTENDGT